MGIVWDTVRKDFVIQGGIGIHYQAKVFIKHIKGQVNTLLTRSIATYNSKVSLVINATKGVSWRISTRMFID